MSEPSRPEGDPRRGRPGDGVEISATEARGGKIVMGRGAGLLWIAGIAVIVIVFVLIGLFARPG